MSEEKVYADGLRTFARNANAPTWILGQLVIDLNEFVSWANSHPEYQSEYKGKKQLRMDISTCKDGRPSLYVNTFGLGRATDETGIPMSDLEKSAPPIGSSNRPSVKDEIPSGDLPF